MHSRSRQIHGQILEVNLNNDDKSLCSFSTLYFKPRDSFKLDPIIQTYRVKCLVILISDGTCISIFLWYMYFHFSMVHVFPFFYGTFISISLWYIYFKFSMVHLFPLVYGTCISIFLWYIYFH